MTTETVAAPGMDPPGIDVPAVRPIASLSPSRAADFKTCPLLYRFRSIDRIPEARSSAATRGTLVHSVLERLFDLPAPARTHAAAAALVRPEWEKLLLDDPDVAALFPSDDGSAPAGPELEAWLESSRGLLENYFALEDPTRIEPAAREQHVEVLLEGLTLRGYIDRIDIAPTGDIRIVDYKTGASPREAFEGKALFQMKFYALVLWRTRGVVPRQLRLMYLADRDTLTYSPDAEELERFERTLRAIWAAIALAIETRDFRPSPSRLCDWCDHHARCPAFGGTLPAWPEGAQAGTPEVPDSPAAG
ncbi:MAG: RecB family exonuclease [Pseudonocardiales bacterium]|nr:RecB family exonuclease [Jatrophihabitantaceae bacterium]MCW2605159.1 RecB family exonuclease [Pseudonocardiales bacterium]